MPKYIPPEPQDIAFTLSAIRWQDDEPEGCPLVDAAAHLANERTFLAWSFTSLFIMSGGIALARTLIILNTSPLSAGVSGRVSPLFSPTTLGLLFLGAGLVIMILAACRYLSVQVQIMEHRYRPSGTSVMMYLTIMMFLCAVLAGFLLQLRGMF